MKLTPSRMRGWQDSPNLDFSDIRRYAPGTHHGLLLVRLRAPGRAALARRIEAVFQAESVETWHRAFVVVTDRKLRIRRPKTG